MARKTELAKIEVVVINGLVVETENKSFARNLSMLEKAREDGMKAGWKACNAMYNIVNGKQFEEDFKTKEKFADAIGYSKGVITKMLKAWEFKNSDEDLKRLDTIGYEKVYNLSNISDYEGFKEFALEKTGKNAWELGDNAMRKVVSEFNASKNEEGKTEEGKTEEIKTEEGKTEELREVSFLAPDGSKLTAKLSNKDIDTICKIMRKGDYTIHDADGRQVYPLSATPIKK